MSATNTRTVLFPGRFQPFHAGHAAIIEKLLKEGSKVVVGVRGFHPTQDNPYAYTQVVHQVQKRFPGVDVVWLPPFDELAHGRDPGWVVREIDIDEPVSARRLRVGMVVWITGQRGSGKSTLAQSLQATYLSAAIVLDGNEMRHTISLGDGYDYDGHRDHNLRVARLAGLLASQGHVVIVSVIAPYRMVRQAIDDDFHPFWIYLPGASEEAKENDWPYERPDREGSTEYLVVNPGLLPEEATKEVWRWLSVSLYNLEQPE